MTYDPNDILWEDPPERRAANTRWVDTFVEHCKKHPGKWARVITPPASWSRGTR